MGVKLPPLKLPEPEPEPEPQENDNNDGGKNKKKKKKKKKKQKKKKQKIVDQRIYLVDEFYPNAKIGDKLSELGKYKEYSNINDVEELQSKYYLQQQNVLKNLEKGNKKWVDLWNKTKKWSLDEFKEIYNWIGARFDHDFFESECSEASRELVEEYFDKGIFVESEGAKGIHLTDEKLGFCMLLKSNGSGLYATNQATELYVNGITVLILFNMRCKTKM